MKTLAIKRESEFVFSVVSSFAFWSNGDGRINERVAFNAAGNLSNMTAQTLDSKKGIHYLLTAPFSVKNPAVIQAAKQLLIGQSQTVVV